VESSCASEKDYQTPTRQENLVPIYGEATMAIVRLVKEHFGKLDLLTIDRFHTNLPLLHFLADRKAFSSPTPLLLASILYISALHRNSPESAAQAPEYLIATCNAIADLVMPPSSLGLFPGSQEKSFNTKPSASKEEERVFNNILGLIMASLSSEAFIETTGTWIAIGYRLLLDHCPHQVQDNGHDWRGLFSGLQVCLLKMESSTR
jgi:hypothetical protein